MLACDGCGKQLSSAYTIYHSIHEEMLALCGECRPAFEYDKNRFIDKLSKESSKIPKEHKVSMDAFDYLKDQIQLLVYNNQDVTISTENWLPHLGLASWWEFVSGRLREIMNESKSSDEEKKGSKVQ